MMEIALGDDLSKHRKPSKKLKVKGCPKCGVLNHVCKKKCNECNYCFYTRKKRKQKSIKKYKNQVDNWKELEIGLEVYIQSNDYYTNSNDEIIDLSYNQEFIIKDKKTSGLVVYSPKLGWAFIDMIREGMRKETLITRTIPKIYTR